MYTISTLAFVKALDNGTSVNCPNGAMHALSVIWYSCKALVNVTLFGLRAQILSCHDENAHTSSFISASRSYLRSIYITLTFCAAAILLLTLHATRQGRGGRSVSINPQKPGDTLTDPLFEPGASFSRTT